MVWKGVVTLKYSQPLRNQIPRKSFRSPEKERRNNDFNNSDKKVPDLNISSITDITRSCPDLNSKFKEVSEDPSVVHQAHYLEVSKPFERTQSEPPFIFKATGKKVPFSSSSQESTLDIMHVASTV